jgi:hypothetical protein
MRRAWVFAVLTLAALYLASPARAADRIPPCRLDDSSKAVVAQTLRRALEAYRLLGNVLAIDTVEVNPSTPSAEAVLSAFVVLDAAQDKVTPKGCATTTVAKDDVLDSLSVRGGCVVVAIDLMEIRCSSGAVEIFANVGQRSERANPALLYVLAHELAHLYQRRTGEYAGRTERIELNWNPAAKIELLRAACDPVSVRREEEADAMSLQVLTLLLPAAPYREPLFSERGSLYWNIDQLALASDAWQKTAIEREFISQPRLHPAFVPTEFPAPQTAIERNARRFVCDVLTKRQGVVLYPGKSVTHPPLEQRPRRIAETLRPVAAKLPAGGVPQDFEPLARLQQDLSPIFTHIYRETGVYLEAVENKICTAVNAADPTMACR